jgi:hypothetical protein
MSDGKLYLPDSDNNRVMVYDSVPTANVNANMVLGQQYFDTVDSGTGAAQLHGPRTVAAASGTLLIGDFLNNRVLVFNAMPASSGASANVVVGQNTFGSASNDCNEHTLYTPESILVVNGQLLVADTNHNRVLIWNSIPTTSGAPADLVLGQRDFSTCNANDIATGPVANAGAGTFNFPTDLWSDGTRLVVVDDQNHRVLIWNTFPTANFTPADVVLGQTVMDGKDPGSTRAGLNYPWSVSSNGNQLFIADQGNNRVLVWNTFPTANGTEPDVVLGQGDFTHVAFNDDLQNGGTSSPSARTLYMPSGVALWGSQLFVADGGNDRYLIYDAQ